MSEKRGIRLTDPEAVRRLLARTVNELLGDTMSPDKGRAVGYLCRGLLECFEFSLFERRITALEKHLDERGVDDLDSEEPETA